LCDFCVLVDSKAGLPIGNLALFFGLFQTKLSFAVVPAANGRFAAGPAGMHGAFKAVVAAKVGALAAGNLVHAAHLVQAMTPADPQLPEAA
jgi:hypothetical protein